MTGFPPIRELVPHDPPMILLDRVVHCDDNGLGAVVTIRRDSLFAGEEGVPAWVGVEYMGQAIAAWAGVRARRDNEPVRIGFLVSTRRYEPGCSYFPLDAQLRVAVAPITDNDVGLQVFHCTITGPEVDASANLNVYMPDDVHQFLRENKP